MEDAIYILASYLRCIRNLLDGQSMFPRMPLNYISFFSFDCANNFVLFLFYFIYLLYKEI